MTVGAVAIASMPSSAPVPASSRDEAATGVVAIGGAAGTGHESRGEADLSCSLASAEGTGGGAASALVSPAASAGTSEAASGGESLHEAWHKQKGQSGWSFCTNPGQNGSFCCSKLIRELRPGGHRTIHRPWCSLILGGTGIRCTPASPKASC